MSCRVGRGVELLNGDAAGSLAAAVSKELQLVEPTRLPDGRFRLAAGIKGKGDG